MANVLIIDNQIILTRKNLITNPSFTDLLENWSGAIPLFDEALYGVATYYDGSGGCTIINNPGEGKCAYFYPSVYSSNRYLQTRYISIDIDTRAEDTYHANALVKQSDTTSKPEIVLLAYTLSGVLLGSIKGDINYGTSDWSTISTGDYQLPLNTAKVRVRLTARGVGEYSFDKVMLEKNNGAMPTVYSDYYDTEGTYETVGLDTSLFDTFGILNWSETVPDGCDISFKTKTAGEDSVYGSWSSSLTFSGQQITSTLQKWFKIQATLTSNGIATPILLDITPYIQATTFNNSRSLKISSLSSTDTITITSQAVETKPETEYTVGVSFKTILDSGAINLTIEEYDIEDTLLGSYSVIDGGLLGENEWLLIPYSYTFVTTTLTSYLKFVIDFNTAQGVAWVDQVRLHEGGSLLTYWGDGWINCYTSRDDGTTWYDITSIVNEPNSYFVFPDIGSVKNKIRFKTEFNRSVLGNVNNAVTPFIHSFQSDIIY